ncbi:unnamed protein product [Kluyveromyces dobzhanskii CBS 2104]|uniref:acid phosphatase n=1 Tax=Kluyveromyces dobzhanskii CBS 2104 TaxID=1427455 RepID=A0A0A8LE06_9SACH|nr:unnamed protein product [Kluyveromyces dobzhanskii CBS 2104]
MRFPLLNGEGPYFSYPITYGVSTEVPEECYIEQVQMIARHAERFPKAAKGEKLEKLWNKLKVFKGEFKGPLSIFNDYEYPITNSEYLEQMTNSSNVDESNPYMGSKTAQRIGSYVASKYSELIGESLPVFSTDAGRVYETARNMIVGLQEALEVTVQLQIIPEDENSGPNSLTPRNSCKNYDSEFADQFSKNVNNSHLQRIRGRLMEKNSHLKLTLNNKDIKRLISWCAYEINIKGYSPVCDLFDEEDLNSYSDSADVANFYNNGLGNPVVQSIGSVLLNASYELIKGSERLDNKVWLTFSHDTDIQHYVSAIGLFDTRAPHVAAYQFSFQSASQKGSWTTPMGARIFTERLHCGENSFVRYIVNDGVIPLPGCSSGPGLSCPLSEFRVYIEKRLTKKNYLSDCDVSQYSNNTELSFFWDYKTVDYTATPINYKVSKRLIESGN